MSDKNVLSFIGQLKYQRKHRCELEWYSGSSLLFCHCICNIFGSCILPLTGNYYYGIFPTLLIKMTITISISVLSLAYRNMCIFVLTPVTEYAVFSVLFYFDKRI